MWKGKQQALLFYLGMIYIFSFAACSSVQDADELNGQSSEKEETIPVSAERTTSIKTPEPTDTQIPESSPTSDPTDTPTPGPTIIPTPRIWPRNVYEEFMFGHKEIGANMERLIQSGWNDYDGIALLDNYPCYLYNLCPANNNFQNVSVIMNAFTQNNSGDFWCEWACQGVYHGFSPYSKGGIKFTYYQLHFAFGDPSREPYCPQFAVTFSIDPDFYWERDFNCEVEQERDPIPYGNLGWSKETRQKIIDKYLWPILDDGYTDEFWGNPEDDRWTADEVENLTDLAICDIVADGHYVFGFPEFFPFGTYYDEKTGVQTLRMRNQLREQLQRELGESVEGNPPLCPGFLGLIDERWIQ